jgi:hypothetical protein
LQEGHDAHAFMEHDGDRSGNHEGHHDL